jgi:hypothetical protein
MSMTQEQRDLVLKKFAEGIASKALGIAWYDTESQARTVAQASAEALLAVVMKALVVKNAENSYEYHKAVGELVELIIGDLPDGQPQ